MVLVSILSEWKTFFLTAISKHDTTFNVWCKNKAKFFVYKGTFYWIFVFKNFFLTCWLLPKVDVLVKLSFSSFCWSTFVVSSKSLVSPQIQAKDKNKSKSFAALPSVHEGSNSQTIVKTGDYFLFGM